MEDMFRNASQIVSNSQIAQEPKLHNEDSSFGPQSLETFVDLGLSDLQIARYFRTSENRVVSLRRYYGLS
jgi:hypothetical protein